MDEAAHRLHHLVMDFVREFRLLEPEWTGEAEHGSLSLSQAFTLHELDVHGGLSQAELAERLHLEKSTVSRMAAALERRGLLARERDPRNRRLYRLRLTEAGRAAHRDMARTADASFERMARTLAPDELDAALTGLAALLRAVREDEQHTPAQADGDAQAG